MRLQHVSQQIGWNPMNRIGKLVAVGILAAFLAACGGGTGSGGSPTSGQATSSATHEKGSSTTSTPAPAGKVVCKAMSQAEVSRIIGMTVYSSDNDGFPSTCSYYTDPDGVEGVTLKVMTKEESEWSQRGKADEVTGAKTSHLAGAQFGGDDALKEVLFYEGNVVTVTYWVLLGDKVVHVQETNGLPDGKLRDLVRAAVKML